MIQNLGEKLKSHNKIFIIVILCMGVFMMNCGGTRETFTNPIISKPSADPWVIRVGDYYYYTHSMDRGIAVRRSKTLQGIGQAEDNIIWKAPYFKMYSEEIWAPELHYVQGRWYVYFAADNGNNDNHRMYVLEGGSDPEDPLNGTYEFKGKISDKTDKWAIDGTVLEMDDGSLYFIWSGWEGDINGRQDLYIAPMSNPWTISGDRVLISKPTKSWEIQGMAINEGPEVLKKDGKIFIIYSASGSWTEHYCLGMLINTDGNVLNASSWVKSDEPVFKGSHKNKSFGVGHCSFVKSPDGKEDWIVYHGMTGDIGWEARDVRAQKFTWDENGMPVFGEPAAVGTPIEEPSGQ